jgi:hypothetical protein
MDPMDFDAERIIKGCQQFAWAMANQPDVEEPMWRAMVGTLLNTSTPDIIHEFSKNHPTYSKEETDEKAAAWRGGGVTCAYLEDSRAPGCNGCKHKGKINSPSALGFKVQALDARQRDDVTSDQDWIAAPLPEDLYTFYSEAAAVAYLNRRIAFLPRNNSIIDRALADDEGDPFQYMRVRAASDTFANCQVIFANGDKTTVKPAFDVWLKSPNRREYRRVVFDASGKQLPRRTLNLWQGYGVQPKEGDCSLILKHMLEIICSADQDQFNYLYWMLAWKVQHPHLPTEVALVLRTDEEGAGKDTLFIILKKIFGPHYRVAANLDHLFKWNAGLLSNAAIVSIGEMLWSGNHAHRGRFKDMITAHKVGTEAKFAPPGSTVNTVMYLISSNEDWVVPAGRDARRFFIPDVSSARVGDKPYFDALYAEINGGGPAALLHDLCTFPLNDWHPRDDIPQTAALKEQKLQSLDPIARFWQDVLDAGDVSYRLPSGATVIDATAWASGPVVVDKEGLRDAFLAWARQQRLVDRKGITKAEFFRQLRQYAPGGTQRAPGIGTRLGAQFSDHATCVAQFEAALKRK